MPETVPFGHSGETGVRRVGIDAVKVIAAAMVLLQHVTGEIASKSSSPAGVVFLNGLTWAAVPLFFATSGYLYGRKLRVPGFDRWTWGRTRVRRILVPYGAWTAIYLLGAAIRIGEMQNHDWVSVIFHGGAFYTLWFFPALLWVTIIVLGIGRNAAALLALAGVSMVVTLAAVALPQGLTLFIPSSVAVLAPSVAVFSVGAWLAMREPRVSAVLPPAALIALALPLMGSLALAAFQHPESPAIRAGAVAVAYAASLPAVWLALRWQNESPHWLSRAATLALGFYLVQGGVLYAFTLGLPSDSLPASVWITTAFIATGVVSAVMCLALYAVRPLRRLVA